MTHPIRTLAWPQRAAALLLGASLFAALPACAPVVVGGAMVGGALMATDRRTTGAQVEDQGIELKAPQQIAAAIGGRGNVSVTSYNRMALITGEVPSEADRVAAEQAVARVENVRSIVNELAVMGNSSLTARSNDSIVTGQVKAAFLDVKGIDATSIKVVTERGTTYLMGRVTEAEARRAGEVARAVSGVQKVVLVFETISEAELAALKNQGGTPAK
jgi:osmotically-inducible protein OsmY